MGFANSKSLKTRCFRGFLLAQKQRLTTIQFSSIPREVEPARHGFIMASCAPARGELERMSAEPAVRMEVRRQWANIKVRIIFRRPRDSRLTSAVERGTMGVQFSCGMTKDMTSPIRLLREGAPPAESALGCPDEATTF